MQKLINRFRREEEGAALVEYGMLVGLIAVICVVAVTTLGTEVSTAFSNIASALAPSYLNGRLAWSIGAHPRSTAPSSFARRGRELWKEKLDAQIDLPLRH